jgi:predicted outer membrane repeat protein
VDHGTATLDRVEIAQNRALSGGGAIAADGGSVTLTNVEVRGNTTADANGGGITSNNGTVVTLRNVRFTANESDAMGGGLHGMNITGIVENCLFDGNSSGMAGGVAIISDGAFTFRNSIVTGNSGGGFLSVGAEMIADWNNVWGNIGGDYVSMAPGPNDLSMDPLFVDAPGGDLGLAQLSPCIDRGQDDPGCLDPDGSRGDMGLLGGPGADFIAPAYVTGAAIEDLGGGSVRVTWTAGGEPDLDHYAIYCDSTTVFTPSAGNLAGTVAHPTTQFEDTVPYENCYYLVAAVDADGHSGGYSAPVYASGTSAVGEEGQLPQAMAIARIVPNPFNPMTTIYYDVPKTGQVKLAVFDIRGRLVRELVTGPVPAGNHRVVWDGRDGQGQMSAAGVYFARMVMDQQIKTQKMVLAK